MNAGGGKKQQVLFHDPQPSSSAAQWPPDPTVFDYVAAEQNHPNKLTACQLNKALEKSFIHTKNSAVQSENKLLQVFN